MIVKESDIRKKIRRLLSEGEETFKYYDASDRERTTMAPREGHIVDLTNNPISSNILHKLTDGSSKSYIAWKIVFEKLFINNNSSTKDTNTSDRNYFFADVLWDNVYYSIKSTLSGDRTAGSFQNKAYSGNPTFTESFIKSCASGDNSTRKWGIIVASKIGNELIWQTIGEPKSGLDIYSTWSALPDDDKVKATLKRGKNTGDVIKYFFGEGKDDVFKILLAPPLENKNANDVLKRIYDKLDQLEYEIETNPQINSKEDVVTLSISKLIDVIRDNNQVSTQAEVDIP